ncbi:MAG: S8 family serine peptidase, partial [Methylococcales bacterium]|nr:S8 family serine peptidase [Methylococcales bacterium]
MKNRLTTVVILFAMLLVLAIGVGGAAADSTQTAEITSAEIQNIGNVLEPVGVTGSARYIVRLNDVPLALYNGGVEGFAATNAAARGQAKLDVKSADSVAYMGYLDAQRAVAIADAEAAIGRDLAVEFELRASMNGYIAVMTPAEAARIAALSQVNLVERERMFFTDTDNGPAWLGAEGIWDGTDTGGLPGTKGEGIIVGIIDTGIDPWNPSFLATGDDGYTHTNPGAGYLGVCDPTNTTPPAGVVAYDATFPCNDKLIGVWGYTASDASPRDLDGHGSHTASTSAGNVISNSVINSPTATFNAAISGVAPHANIIMYDGCGPAGCPGASLTAARDQLLLDGVDVVNYSIGSSSPTGDAWADAEAGQWLAIRAAGIFVATSAGNAGPGDETIGSPGDIPWIMTVGASSHNRAFLNSITLDDGTRAPLVLNGLSMTSALAVPTEVVYSIDFAGGGISVEDARLCADG